MIQEWDPQPLETTCPDGKQHCDCWYDDAPCCYCGDDTKEPDNG